jgi:hypothetical protein
MNNLLAGLEDFCDVAHRLAKFQLTRAGRGVFRRWSIASRYFTIASIGGKLSNLPKADQ